MEEEFDFEGLKKVNKNSRYAEVISNLKEQDFETEGIEETVKSSIENIDSGVKSFVICGDPQSGKTMMMISLTAKLLDDGHRLIVHLIPDNLSLLEQNLKRFAKSGLDPSPKSFESILNENIDIKNGEWVIFCTKNKFNLQKLIEKLKEIPDKVIIDDEADSATPNSRIRKGGKSSINDLTGKLMEQEKGGIWIAVTATPSRIDVNNTHNNLNDHWVYFPSHSKYNGPDTFFPMDKEFLEYSLKFIPDNEEEYENNLRLTFFRFLTNVSYINLFEKREHYSFLIHTSGQIKGHQMDENIIIKIITALRDKNNPFARNYYNELFKIAEEGYPKKGEEIVKFIFRNIGRNEIIVMNYNKAKKSGKVGADPSSLFTIIIGGNIVSRGVTFNNLLSMFFTRTVKGKYHQDTYIQRARMFGVRGDYLKYFELTIPEELYLNWWDCFFYHRIGMEYIKEGKPPTWPYGGNIVPTGLSSVDKDNIKDESGEMIFEMIPYKKEEDFIQLWDVKNPLESLTNLRKKFGEKAIPEITIRYIKSTLKDPLIKLNKPYHPKGKDVDQSTLKRKKKHMSTSAEDFNDYDHHFLLIYNPDKKFFRIIYRPTKRRLGFLKNMKNISE